MDDSELFGGSDDFGGPDVAYEESHDPSFLGGSIASDADIDNSTNKNNTNNSNNVNNNAKKSPVGQVVQNRPFDEAFEVSSAEEGDLSAALNDNNINNDDSDIISSDLNNNNNNNDNNDYSNNNNNNNDGGGDPMEFGDDDREMYGTGKEDGGSPPKGEEFNGDEDESLDNGDGFFEFENNNNNNNGSGNNNDGYNDINNSHNASAAMPEREQFQQMGNDNDVKIDGGNNGDSNNGFGDDGGDVEDSMGDDYVPDGGYDPEEFASLDVDSEVRELFQKITRYEPATVELDTPLLPFIPDYIPAVGDLDAFIKVDRPDAREDGLGTKVLDEPAVKQSNPAALRLELKSKTKKVIPGSDGRSSSASRSDPDTVGSTTLDNVRAIDEWVASAEKVHRSGAASRYDYRGDMPQVDSLMQVWPAEMENLIETVKLPGAELDVSLEEYTSIICALLDIPVNNAAGGGKLDALHLLFTLYSEFMQSQHFGTAGIAAENVNPGQGAGFPAPPLQP